MPPVDRQWRNPTRAFQTVSLGTVTGELRAFESSDGYPDRERRQHLRQLHE